MFFVPGESRPWPIVSAQWNRGAYLVRAHGSASGLPFPARNAFGANEQEASS